MIGSELIGQNFTADRYFHGRPSVTTGRIRSRNGLPPYNAASSSGSNLGPTSKTLIDRVNGDAAKLQAENPGAARARRSRDHFGQRAGSRHHAGGGLFPGAAGGQGARTSGRPASASLSQAQIEDRILGVIGEPHVNVLKLNLALDAACQRRARHELWLRANERRRSAPTNARRRKLSWSRPAQKAAAG